MLPGNKVFSDRSDKRCISCRRKALTKRKLFTLLIRSECHLPVEEMAPVVRQQMKLLEKLYRVMLNHVKTHAV